MERSDQEGFDIVVAIVEDNKRFVDSFRKYFSRKNFVKELKVFRDMREFRGLKEINFDIAILDINLPDGRGIDLIPYIKDRSPQTEILMLTAFSEEDRLFEALKLGASGYITKSNSLEYVEEAIKEILAGGAVISPDMTARFLNYFSASKRIDVSSHNAVDLDKDEMDVLYILARGLTNREIGETLYMRYRYVKTVLSRIYKKFGTSSRSEVVRRAIEMGLIEI